MSISHAPTHRVNRSMMQESIDRTRLLFSLVRRDYAVQFAGTALGLTWLFVQYGFQIAVFYAVFGVLLGGPRSGLGPEGSDYLVYLLSGMSLWIPLSEMLIRSGSILSENRALIRRTSVGADLFARVPFVQAILHYTLLALLTAPIAYFRGALAPTVFLAFPVGLLVLWFFSGWALVFARMSVILKDVSPILRLLLQVVFWCTPFVYSIPPRLMGVMAWNPLYGPLELHRALFSGTSFPPMLVYQGALALALLSIPLFLLASLRLGNITADHL